MLGNMNFFSRVEQEFLTVRFAHSWDILVNNQNKFYIFRTPCILLYILLYSIHGINLTSHCSSIYYFRLTRHLCTLPPTRWEKQNGCRSTGWEHMVVQEWVCAHLSELVYACACRSGWCVYIWVWASACACRSGCGCVTKDRVHVNVANDLT